MNHSTLLDDADAMSVRLLLFSMSPDKRSIELDAATQIQADVEFFVSSFKQAYPKSPEITLSKSGREEIRRAGKVLDQYRNALEWPNEAISAAQIITTWVSRMRKIARTEYDLPTDSKFDRI